MIKFRRPVEFTVKMGKNNQAIVIHLVPDAAQQKEESKPVSAANNSLVTPLAILPVAVAAAPTVVTPPMAVVSPGAPTASTTPEKSPVVKSVISTPPMSATAKQMPEAPIPATATKPATPAMTPAMTPATSTPVPAAVAPSGEVTAPKVALAPSLLKPVHIPLGGKDGLPAFPDIDQAGTMGNKPLPEKPSLADQIMKANLQAAVLMEKGGNALLTGQTIVAVESFNNVLNLPPSKYTEDAQLWVGIARERSGQQAKAILEFNSYLKIYPDGKSAWWVKNRLDKLKLSQPALFAENGKSAKSPAKAPNTEMQISEFGSVSMYYYTGQSQIDTSALAGTVQAPTSFSTKDQKSLIANVTMTARAYNNEYDNRLVFQGFGAKNFLQGQASRNRLGAAYYEVKDRIVNYSAKVGVQSGYGGGVMGKFQGVSGGVGFADNWRVNVQVGQLIDFTEDTKPKFKSVGLDFGTRSALGGSVYLINQQVSGVTDRRAVGGNLRYFEQGFTVMSMVDYDLQFKALNILTVQGTLTSNGNGTDYNFLLDRRRSPILDIRNAVNGTAKTFYELIQQEYTTSALVDLAKQRTSFTTLAQVGMTNHLSEKWSMGTDLTLSKTAGLEATGQIDPFNGCIATEGCVAAQPDSGNTSTVGERLTGIGVFQPRDITNFSVSYTKSQMTRSEAFQVSNHSDFLEFWTVDSALHLGVQNYNAGSKTTDISPTVMVAYKVRNYLTLESQLGLDFSKTSSSELQSSSKSRREFVSMGFRADF